MLVDTKYRTTKEEYLDDFSLKGDELRDAIDKIATINQWLGGNRVTLDGIKKLLKNYSKNKVISVIDIGCGNGDMCRAIADFGKKEGIKFTILGIDANTHIIEYARTCSRDYPTISYSNLDVFSDAFDSLSYDIAVCTLTLHHFTNNEILPLVRELANRATVGIVINDLERSALAYRLFQLICCVFRLSALSRDDGLVSILRGFKRADLEHFANQLQLTKYTINWRWAFRYQWIINNL